MANKLIFETLKAKEDKLQAKLDKLNKKDRVVRDAKTKALNDTLRSYFEGTEGIETNLVDLRYEPTYGSSMEITAKVLHMKKIYGMKISKIMKLRLYLEEMRSVLFT